MGTRRDAAGCGTAAGSGLQLHCSVDAILSGGSGCGGYRRHVTVAQMREALGAVNHIGETLGRDHFIYICIVNALNERMNTTIERAFAEPHIVDVFTIEFLEACIRNGDYEDPRDVTAHLPPSRERPPGRSFFDAAGMAERWTRHGYTRGRVNKIRMEGRKINGFRKQKCERQKNGFEGNAFIANDGYAGYRVQEENWKARENSGFHRRKSKKGRKFFEKAAQNPLICADVSCIISLLSV